VERKLTRTAGELEDEEEEEDQVAAQSDDDDEEEDADDSNGGVLYNPKGLPLGWDGKVCCGCCCCCCWGFVCSFFGHVRVRFNKRSTRDSLSRTGCTSCTASTSATTAKFAATIRTAAPKHFSATSTSGVTQTACGASVCLLCFATVGSTTL
jgi:hypothetical protein